MRTHTLHYRTPYIRIRWTRVNFLTIKQRNVTLYIGTIPY